MPKMSDAPSIMDMLDADYEADDRSSSTPADRGSTAIPAGRVSTAIPADHGTTGSKLRSSASAHSLYRERRDAEWLQQTTTDKLSQQVVEIDEFLTRTAQADNFYRRENALIEKLAAQDGVPSWSERRPHSILPNGGRMAVPGMPSAASMQDLRSARWSGSPVDNFTSPSSLPSLSSLRAGVGSSWSPPLSTPTGGASASRRDSAKVLRFDDSTRPRLRKVRSDGDDDARQARVPTWPTKQPGEEPRAAFAAALSWPAPLEKETNEEQSRSSRSLAGNSAGASLRNFDAARMWRKVNLITTLAKRNPNRVPKLRELAPEPMYAPADTFDRRHASKTAKLKKANHLMKHGLAGEAKAEEVFERLIFDVSTHRFVASSNDQPSSPRGLTQVIKGNHSTWHRHVSSPERPVTAAAGTAGNGDGPSAHDETDSSTIVRARNSELWSGRIPTNDSKDVVDSTETKFKVFESHWRLLLPFCTKLIIKNDDNGAEDDDGDGIPDEIQEVGECLWAHQDTTFSIFTYYASLESDADMENIGMNAWTQFCIDFKLIDKKSKLCKAADLDRLFIAVDAQSMRAGQEANKGQGKTQDKLKALSRVEWLAALVHIAILKYIKTEKETDVSEAMERLLAVDITARLTPACTEANVFRREVLYTKEVTDELIHQRESLWNIFEGVAGSTGGKNNVNSLLVDLNEWRTSIRALHLIDKDITERDVTLCFAWSRFYVPEKKSLKAMIRIRSLDFLGWLEALVRLAMLKALPTEEEIDLTFCKNAGEWLDEKFGMPEYKEVMDTRATPWGQVPAYQPAHISVRQMVQLFIHRIEKELAGQGVGDGTITAREVTRWFLAKKQ